jgi:inner membrane protein
MEGSLPAYLAGLALGAAIPDIDEKKSWIGVRTRFISDTISLFVKHRGVTHTILAALLVFAALFIGLYETSYRPMAAGAGVGMILHALGDMSTKEGGIALFFPVSIKRLYALPSIMRYSTGGLVENLIVFPVFFMLLVMEIYWLVFIEKIPAF